MKATFFIFLLGLGLSFSAMAASPFDSPLPQDNGSKYGKDSVTCVQNLSLYHEFYKQWRQSGYQNKAIYDAVGPWYWVFNNCPRATENIYIDGVNMLSFRIQSAPADKRKSMIDTLMMIFDQRLKYFPDRYGTTQSQKGEILARKAIALYQVDPGAYQKVYQILKESINEEKQESMGAAMVYYFRILAKMVREGQADTTTLVNTYDQLSGYVSDRLNNYQSMNNARKVSEYKNIKNAIESEFQPFANCKDLVSIYQKKFNASPEDASLLKKIISTLENKQCFNNNLYFDANQNLYKVQKDPETAFLIGKLLIQQGKNTEALSYLQKATSITDTDDLVDVYMLMAQTYQGMSNYPKAREMARMALKTNPHYGMAYVLIGDMYASSASACGKNDLTKKVAYWAAVDKYEQAKRVEPDLADLVNKRVSVYRQQFPSTEQLFFYNMKPGEKYKVGCWINEETTVRAYK
ncbi:MAG: hypothetical protein JXR71_10765 [Bacteroidales bacterium]|nr:hypothetical protein [Bacteroidales bacterium]